MSAMPFKGCPQPYVSTTLSGYARDGQLIAVVRGIGHSGWGIRNDRVLALFRETVVRIGPNALNEYSLAVD